MCLFCVVMETVPVAAFLIMPAGTSKSSVLQLIIKGAYIFHVSFPQKI